MISDPTIAKSPGELRSLLVVPRGAINPRTGGGQRSLLYFSALKQLGETDVAVLGISASSGIEVFFEGNSGFHTLPTARIDTRMSSVQRAVASLTKLFLPRTAFAVDPTVRDQLSVLIDGRAYDAIVFRYSTPFCIAGLEATPGRAPAIIVDIDDSESQTMLSKISKIVGKTASNNVITRWMIRHLERVVMQRLSHATAFFFTAAEDIETPTGLGSAVIPNVPFFDSEDHMARPPSGSRDVLFVGSFGHKPNEEGVVWFLHNCWPAISASQPDARFRIVGLGDWSQLATRFQTLTGVDYVGTVDDIADEYQRARFAISPIREGGGSKIKVIEACSFGRAVVCHTHSARGFGYELTNALFIAETADDMVSHCIKLLADGEMTDSRGRTAREVQQKTFTRGAVESKICAEVRAIVKP